VGGADGGRQKSLDEAVLLPTGKGFRLTSDLNLQQALLDGYECHRPRSPSQSPSSSRAASPSEDETDEREEEKRRKRRKPATLPKLRIAAMTNDTVATFASLAYSIKSSHAMTNSRVVMGLMVGAGCNATVPMKASSLHKDKTGFIPLPSRADTAAAEESQGETLVSTEWTLRPSSQPLLDMGIMTRWDKTIEATSQPPGFQPMEYMVGGRYMGELVRLIVLEYFTSVLNIPRDILPWHLLETGGLTTEFLSLNVASSTTPEGRDSDKREKDDALAAILNTLLPSTHGWTWNADKASILRSVAYAVQSRSTAIIAAATVGLLACIGEITLSNPTNPVTNSASASDPGPGADAAPSGAGTPEELIVAFSGGVIQNYPRYKESLQRHIDRLLVHGGPQQGGKSILLREVSDGGIIGVGVLAGCSVRGGIEGIVGSRLDFLPTPTGESR
jgi:hexokinase